MCKYIPNILFSVTGDITDIYTFITGYPIYGLIYV